MDTDIKAKVLDENGNTVEADVIDIIEVDGKEYLLYSVDANEEECDLYINRIVKNSNGEDDIIPIEDEEEKRRVFEILNDLMEETDWRVIV